RDLHSFPTRRSSDLLVGDLPERREVYDARIGAGADHDHLRLVSIGKTFDFFIIDGLGFRRHAVRNDVEELAGKIDRAAVGKVSAVGEVHPEDGVAWLA